MKHTASVIVAMVLFYLVAVAIGLTITSRYLGEKEMPLGLKPVETKSSYSFVPIIFFIGLATIAGLMLIRWNMANVWRGWFFLSIFLTLTISFGAFLSEHIAVMLALAFAGWRIFKPNIYVQNFTEIFIYGALAALFVPMLNLISVSVLMILISIYDFIAVRKTKHMIKLAKWESKIKLFSGIVLPYKDGTAILGGGDIGFSLLFAATAMKTLGLPLFSWKNVILPVFSVLALLYLFIFGSKKKFYPAMPYLTISNFIGLAILLMI